jgi:hypothetical protein
MKLYVGPAEPESAAAWIQWADETLADLPDRKTTRLAVSTEAIEDLRGYLEQWRPEVGSTTDPFRWHGELDPEQLEYLVHAVFNLDAHLSCERSSAPHQGRDFYLVLVRALLHALETDSPRRAAFVEELRSSWPIAAEAI